MSENILEKINRDQFRANFLKYTRKAFLTLPKLDNPFILDIGCGSGIPTMELAKLSTGTIFALDTDQLALDKLNKKIKEKKLENRIKTIKCSFYEMNFQDESFDLIWAEGVGYFIRFEESLKQWRRLLKTNGFLVIHDDIKTLPTSRTLIKKYNYKLLDYFALPKDAWWVDYYRPLESRIDELRQRIVKDSSALEVLEQQQQEIDNFKTNPSKARSIFYILQKIMSK